MQCHSPDMTSPASASRFGGLVGFVVHFNVSLSSVFPLQRYNKLLCCLTGNGRHAGRPLCDDIQCICGAIRWQVDVWPIHVQRIQQPGCLLLHGKHIAFVLHIGG